MALRRYSPVIEAREHQTLARWWAQVLGWQQAFDTDQEAPLLPPWAHELGPRPDRWPVLCFRNPHLPDDLATRGEFGAELAPGSKIIPGEGTGIGTRPLGPGELAKRRPRQRSSGR